MPKTSRFRENTQHSEIDSLDQEKTYLHPRQRLYSKRENELLDSIYATDIQADIDVINDEDQGSNEEISLVNEANDFWDIRGREFPERSKKTIYIERAVWFVLGAVITSLIWLIFFQVNVNMIRSKSDTKIVFQNAPDIVTDKAINRQMLNEKTNHKVIEKNFDNKITLPAFSNFFKPKEQDTDSEYVDLLKNSDVEADRDSIEERVETTLAIDNPATIEIPSSVKENAEIHKAEEATANPQQAGPTTHTIRNGDSMWLIAKQYYNDPSPANIQKILNANGLNKYSLLKPGRTIKIPM